MTERPVHTAALEQVREILFPNLPPDVGRARIDDAIARAGDDERWDRIERIVAASDLADELLNELRDRKLPG